MPVLADGWGAADSYLTLSRLAASALALALTYGVSFGDGSCVKSLAVIGTSRESNKCSVHTSIAPARFCLPRSGLPIRCFAGDWGTGHQPV